MGKHRVSSQPSGIDRADFRPISRISRQMGILAMWFASGSGLACSAYDNADTPGHALGSGGKSSNAQGGGGAGNASPGGTSAQGGASTGGTSSGLAGSLGQAGTGLGGTTASGGMSGASGGTGGGSGGSSSAGSAGTGGGAAGAGGSGSGMCSAHPLTAMSKWTVTASSSGGTDVPAHAIDGDLTTRWTSGKDQAGDEWLQVDFSADVTVKKVTLKLGSSMSDYPRSYKTRLTDMANNLAAPAQVMGSGAQAVDTVMSFDAATTGRYLLITQGGTVTGLYWSVAEISVECSD